MKKLIQIVDAQFGANVTGKMVGDFAFVQGRDFDANGEYLGLEPMYADGADLRSVNFLRRGEILFSTKGKIFATVWQDQMANTIASGTFLILRVTDDSVLPEYLALYLNSSKAKRYYDLHVKAATVNHIGRKQLELMEIKIPTIEQQKLLVEVNELIIEEKKLNSELKERKEKILNYLI